MFFGTRFRLVACPLAGLMAAAVLLTGCAGGAQTPRPAPAGGPSAWDAVLDRVRPDGTVDRDTALAAFSLAFGPVPGAKAPAGSRSGLSSATGPVRWVLGHWAELTAEQRRAVRTALFGPRGSTRAAMIRPAAAAQPVTPEDCVSSDSPDAGPWRARFDKAIAEISGKLGGRRLGLATTVVMSKAQRLDPDVIAFMVACPMGSEPKTSCAFNVNPVGEKAPEQAKMGTAYHEVMHCYLLTMKSRVLPLWLEEGIAKWVGESMSGGTEFSQRWWNRYLKAPDRSLFTRSYDAIGFYAHLAQSGRDPWKLFLPMVTADTDEAAFQAAVTPETLDLWPSRYARGRHPGPAWDLTGPAITPAKPTLVVKDVANGSGARLDAGPVANAIAQVNLRADVVRFATGGARGRLGPSSGPDLTLPQLEGDWCAKPGGCRCPGAAGSQLRSIPAGVGYLAVTGGLKAATVTVAGLPLAAACKKPAPPAALSDCLVGRWVSTEAVYDMKIPQASPARGGRGAVFTIGRDGSATIDFTPMQPIVMHMTAAGLPTTMRYRYVGSATGKVALAGTGTYRGVGSSFADVRAVGSIQTPGGSVPFDIPIAKLTSGLAGGAKISQTPVLDGGSYTCSKTTLVLFNKAISGARWTFARQG